MSERTMARLASLGTITSRQNARVMDLVKLNDRKHRKTSGCFRFDGVKLTQEAMRTGLPIRMLFLKSSEAERRLRELCDQGQELPDETEILLLEDSLFDRISEENAPEGVICVCPHLPLHRVSPDCALTDLKARIVALESVRDPSNLGAIIRSAAAFDTDVLLISEDCADIYNAKTVRASMGTLFSQKIVRVPNLPDAIAQLRAQGRRVFAAALDRGAMQLGSFAKQRGDCVVIGNEGHGLSQQTISACDACVYIPMGERAESLNAAVAASILMWEFCEERHAK